MHNSPPGRSLVMPKAQFLSSLPLGLLWELMVTWLLALLVYWTGSSWDSYGRVWKVIAGKYLHLGGCEMRELAHAGGITNLHAGGLW